MGISTDDITELKHNLMEQFRNELPVLRARARASQEVIAEKIGISRQTYSGIETGKREMTWTIFLALLAFFQNNEQTKTMIDQINGFGDSMTKVMESPEH
ncbi:helix-turn-helix transcriptional regulator [Ruminococcus bicirculans (ex Wegman et al. 2014)]|jgi:DNA-binding XRE family transcriptional regulator|uniref:helix-turn-helix transcriptional regulator n=1 Tax=Ruminococcus bicirculans (ex Wegman et al. 2014) TaxID=1160721 RepID=UPI0039907640